MLKAAHRNDVGPFLKAMTPGRVIDFFRSMEASRGAQAYKEAQNALKAQATLKALTARDAWDAQVASEVAAEHDS